MLTSNQLNSNNLILISHFIASITKINISQSAMSKNSQILFIIVLLLAFFIYFIQKRDFQTQSLVAKQANSTLPYPLRESAAVYDGHDNIYIFGGYSNHSIIKLTV
jgi:Na+/proline symporter